MQKFGGESKIAGVGQGVYRSAAVCNVRWFGDVGGGIE